MTTPEGENVPPAGPSAVSRWFTAYSLLTVLLAAVGSVTAVVSQPGRLQDWAAGGLVLALALGFDEASRRAARLRIRLSDQLRTDMTSVWAVAATAALPISTTVVALSAILTYDWFRHHRPAGESFDRKLFVTATILLGCLIASLASHHLLADVVYPIAGRNSVAWSETATVLSVAAVYTVVQRLLVTVALIMLGGRGQTLRGSRDDNLIEVATLCLGGLEGLALDYQPLLAILALAPMITLHRGALVRELETAATTDAKTGLLNAVAWENLCHREIARAARDDTPLAILMIDIDHFKHVNDVHGHLVGDKVLRGLGRHLVTVIREYDSAGRFGGEEFVVVLPDAAVDVAVAIAERIRAQVNTVSVADLADGSDRTGTALAVSIGVAMLREHGDDVTDLLQAADAALYRAKSAGRNRVVLADRDIDGTVREAVGA